MSDCPNVEMRDRLPDLANDSLEPAVRILVLAHLEQCAACTAEIEILRTARLILRETTPRVNVASIEMALPQYGVRAIANAPSARGKSWVASWRAAAAVAFLAAGIGSYALVSNRGTPGVDTPLVAPGDNMVGLALTGALADMSEAELTALASDIGTIEALPSDEVETMSSVIAVPTILPDTLINDPETW